VGRPLTTGLPVRSPALTDPCQSVLEGNTEAQVAPKCQDGVKSVVLKLGRDPQVGRRGITGGARGALRRTSHITKVCVNIDVTVTALTGYACACAIGTSQMLRRPWQEKG